MSNTIMILRNKKLKIFLKVLNNDIWKETKNTKTGVTCERKTSGVMGVKVGTKVSFYLYLYIY